MVDFIINEDNDFSSENFNEINSDIETLNNSEIVDGN